MIGEHGWVLHFDVEGCADQAAMQTAIMARLDKFWPGQEDDGWRLDVDVHPHVHSADGGTLSWRAEVIAQRVKVRSPREHDPEPAEFPAGQLEASG